MPSLHGAPVDSFRDSLNYGSAMRLLHRLPESHEDRTTLGIFCDTRKYSKWFERAELIDTTTPKTLEVYVTDTPPEDILLKFTDTQGLALKIINV